MKRFRYRLERVLQFREIIKADKERLLGLARQELASAVQRLKALEAELMVDRLSGRDLLTVDELQLFQAYSIWLRKEIEKQTAVIASCEEKVEKALVEYIEATKDAESLVRHKDKKRIEYDEYLEKEQQKFLDELTTQRIGRAKLSESLAQRSESQPEEETTL